MSLSQYAQKHGDQQALEQRRKDLIFLSKPSSTKNNRSRARDAKRREGIATGGEFTEELGNELAAIETILAMRRASQEALSEVQTLRQGIAETRQGVHSTVGSSGDTAWLGEDLEANELTPPQRTAMNYGLVLQRARFVASNPAAHAELCCQNALEHMENQTDIGAQVLQASTCITEWLGDETTLTDFTEALQNASRGGSRVNTTALVSFVTDLVDRLQVQALHQSALESLSETQRILLLQVILMELRQVSIPGIEPEMIDVFLEALAYTLARDVPGLQQMSFESGRYLTGPTQTLSNSHLQTRLDHLSRVSNHILNKTPSDLRTGNTQQIRVLAHALETRDTSNEALPMLEILDDGPTTFTAVGDSNNTVRFCVQPQQQWVQMITVDDYSSVHVNVDGDVDQEIVPPHVPANETEQTQSSHQTVRERGLELVSDRLELLRIACPDLIGNPAVEFVEIDGRIFYLLSAEDVNNVPQPNRCTACDITDVILRLKQASTLHQDEGQATYCYELPSITELEAELLDEHGVDTDLSVQRGAPVGGASTPAESSGESTPRPVHRHLRAIWSVLLREGIHADYYTGQGQPFVDFRTCAPGQTLVITIPERTNESGETIAARQLVIRGGDGGSAWIMPTVRDPTHYDTRSTTQALKEDGGAPLTWANTRRNFETVVSKALSMDPDVIATADLGSIDAYLDRNMRSFGLMLLGVTGHANAKEKAVATEQNITWHKIARCLRADDQAQGPHSDLVPATCGDTVVNRVIHDSGGQFRDFNWFGQVQQRFFERLANLGIDLGQLNEGNIDLRQIIDEHFPPSPSDSTS